MSCNRAQQIDIDAFLVDSTAPELAEFRDHYPGCADCSATVADWSALGLALRSMSGPTRSSDASAFGESADLSLHPDPWDLEMLIDPPSMTSELVTAAAHVETCGHCQSEMRLLRAFDASELAAAHALGASSKDVDVREASSILISIRSFFGSLASGLQPATLAGLGVAALAVAGIWWSGGFAGMLGDSADSNADVRVVENPVTPPSKPSAEERLAPESIAPAATIPGRPRVVEDAGEAYAAVDPALFTSEVTPDALDASESVDDRVEQDLSPDQQPVPEMEAPGSQDVPTEMLAEVQLDVVPEVAPTPQTRDPISDTRELQEEVLPEALPQSIEREEIMLAALTELPLPSYGAPAGVNATHWARNFGAVRGRNDVSVDSRAPDHVGLTLNAAPSLWWSLDSDSDAPLQVTIVDEDAIEPILRVELAGPHRTGLNSISLTEHGVELKPGVEYRWFISVLLDPDRPSRNPVSGGVIQVVGPDDDRRVAVAAVEDARRGHLLAELGIWYDAYDFFASLAEAHPEIEALERHRDRLQELAQADPR
jgi:hypothetical protein